jgi:acyl-CoA dehydrogenase
MSARWRLRSVICSRRRRGLSAEAALALDAAAGRVRGKLVTGRLFVERLLPETLLHLARIRLGAANLMEWPAKAF